MSGGSRLFRVLVAAGVLFSFAMPSGVIAADDARAQAQEIAMQLQQEKKLEIQEKKILADQHCAAGVQYFEAGDYVQAEKEFDMSLSLDPKSETALSMKEKCAKAKKKAAKEELRRDLRAGIKFYKKGNYQAAIAAFDKVLAVDADNSRALRYKEKSQTALNALEVGGKVSSVIGKAQSEKSRVLYEEGVRLYNAGNYAGAEERFKTAIAANPINIPARRYLEIINERKREFSRRDEQLAVEKAMYDVRQAWLPPSKSLTDTASKKKTYKKTDVKTEQQLIMEEKARQIVPEINFTDAHLRDVIKYLSKISGVNIILDEDLFKRADFNAAAGGAGFEETSGQTGSAAGISEDGIFDEEFKDDAAQAAAGNAATMSVDRSDKITISLTNIPLIEALKYILTTKGLKYRIDDYAILVSTPERLMDVEMETRFYHLSSGAGDYVEFVETQKATDAASGEYREAFTSGIKKPKEFSSIKDVLEQSGVPFPAGAKIFLDRKTGTLLVRNTPSNLALIEDILRTLDVSPFQISVQAKFIEISEGDAKELGFDWAMQNWNVGSNVGPNNAGSVDMAGGDLTRGLRFLGDRDNSYNLTGDNAAGLALDGVRDNVISLVGTLTDPEFSMVLRALEQTGNANQLSAPRITTVNNQSAQIRVVKEYIYPTDYETTPPTTNESGAIVTPPTVTPKDFITRSAGIILDVTPSAGSDRRTIHMTVVPEVSELVGWIDYGANYGQISGQDVEIPILQPLFSNRTLTTSVVVNDGDTVVLGGLMRDNVLSTNDRVPLLGDLPVLGRLFRSESEVRTKTNLMIFVTADLITPSGEEVRNVDIEDQD